MNLSLSELLMELRAQVQQLGLDFSRERPIAAKPKPRRQGRSLHVPVQPKQPPVHTIEPPPEPATKKDERVDRRLPESNPDSMTGRLIGKCIDCEHKLSGTPGRGTKWCPKCFKKHQQMIPIQIDEKPREKKGRTRCPTCGGVKRKTDRQCEKCFQARHTWFPAIEAVIARLIEKGFTMQEIKRIHGELATIIEGIRVLPEMRLRISSMNSVVKISRDGKNLKYAYQGPAPGRWDELEGIDAQEVYRKVLAILKPYPDTTILLPNGWSFGRRTDAVPGQKTAYVLLGKQGQEISAEQDPKEFWRDYGMQLLHGQVKLKPPETRPAPGWEEPQMAGAIPETTTKDPRKAWQFCTKKEAKEAVRKLPGYGPSDIVPIEVMGFKMWSISDAHMNYVMKPKAGG